MTSRSLKAASMTAMSPMWELEAEAEWGEGETWVSPWGAEGRPLQLVLLPAVFRPRVVRRVKRDSSL